MSGSSSSSEFTLSAPFSSTRLRLPVATCFAAWRNVRLVRIQGWWAPEGASASFDQSRWYVPRSMEECRAQWNDRRNRVRRMIEKNGWVDCGVDLGTDGAEEPFLLRDQILAWGQDESEKICREQGAKQSVCRFPRRNGTFWEVGTKRELAEFQRAEWLNRLRQVQCRRSSGSSHVVDGGGDAKYLVQEQ
jgi:hypothetical protein